MKLKFLAAAAVAVFTSAGVHAATPVDLGNVPPTASFSMTHSAGSFFDSWSFNLTSPSYVAASVTNVAVTFASLSTGSITDFAATLNGVALNLSSSTVSPPGTPITVKTQVLAGSSSQLDTGTYLLEVSGVAGLGGASYGGNIVAVPVPEPETYAMMLAGLGALGFLARRRKS